MFEKRSITAALLATAMAATPTAFVMAQQADTATTAETAQGAEIAGQTADSTAKVRTEGDVTTAGTDGDTGAAATADTEARTAGTDTATDTEVTGDSETQMQAEAPQVPNMPVFEDAQIEAFASAVIDVTEIRDRYAAQLQTVDNETDQQTLIEEANAEMRSAIEDTEGLSFEDYMAINRAASMDQDLNQKIAQRLEEMQKAKAG